MSYYRTRPYSEKTQIFHYSIQYGTPVVRTYIDQLAQVLSALLGWSRIDKCPDKGTCQKGVNGYQHGTKDGCKYLKDVKHENKCEKCECMKWDVKKPDQEGTPLGRKCQRCKGSGDAQCSCSTGGCSPGEECQCAKKGKCCKCCCTGCTKCKKECSCIEKESEKKDLGIYVHKETYQSAYWSYTNAKHFEQYGMTATWNALYRYKKVNTNDPPSQRRHQCAQILLGSVCLIWSGVTYMHWTGKYHSGSSYWNNHILDGSGLDDGTLSLWLQALGFPRDMINNHGPRNRLDAVIWDGFMGRLFLGFTHPSGSDGTTAKQPYDMNYAGFVHTAHRDSFYDKARVFPKNGTGSGTDQNKIGAIFKLYILSCAYFTGLQKKTPTQSTTSKTPKTIREILYWLSALPYNQAYPEILEHSKEVLKKVAPEKDGTKTLSFYQTGRTHPITVHEFNLFAHFQAVTQYCPLVLIGIQGGIHSTKGTDSTKEPPIHSLYANTECHFTYPTVSIQAYNQVVHYIRALFYQLYFLRKQCAVKVTCGGKWRECRYGQGVVSKGVISWMCLGCDPMEHDRKSRVNKVKEGLVGVTNGTGKDDTLMKSLVDVLEEIGDVVVQLGNAQERLDTGNNDLGGVMKALNGVFSEVNAGSDLKGVLQKVLGKLETEKVNGLEEKAGSLNGLKEATTKAKAALEAAKDAVGKQNGTDVDPCKNLVSAAIHGLQKALEAFMKWAEQDEKDVIEQAKKTLRHVGTLTNAGDEVNLRNVKLEAHYSAILKSIKDLLSICNSPKCPGCAKHSDKCGQPSKPTICDKCHQPTTTGVPSPLQAFLEDRLPGFSCESTKELLDKQEEDRDQKGGNGTLASVLEYPSAASHLHHTNSPGQCCPLPMGFRNQFYSGSTSDCTGQRLYGILYFFSNENMMQSCVYTLVRVTAELSATTPQVLGDVFGFFRGGVGNKEEAEDKSKGKCDHISNPGEKGNDKKYFCGWCASGLRDEVQGIQWIPKVDDDKGGKYRQSVGQALIEIKGDKGSVGAVAYANPTTTPNNLSTLTEQPQYVSPLTGELYTAVSATFGNTYLSWVLYLSDALEGGLKSLSEAFQQIECNACKGQCDPNKCKKGEHGQKSNPQDAKSTQLCQCQSIVSCTGVLPVLYRHGFSYGNPFNLEGYRQKGEKNGDYSIEKVDAGKKHCHEFLSSLSAVIKKKEEVTRGQDYNHYLECYNDSPSVHHHSYTLYTFFPVELLPGTD
ncbi:variant erythrocyte surface antigen-1 alpha subunit [Babesia bovis T2Bo]|uniref:Variant erythrocyte surface antigen-1, alpha subunit n=1 Tax=Babesia bovis TaxID=5865 RepID=A7AR28_BABBO|nr:variant erythrocyte surface antigen-1 alpha subunit [Babesia bovis T2Bo]EDO06997.1 variant erythrocyte surface antigen-1 alpha subunit [Babesia bovis T2Bo]|eukprot:XP_001610565.1 variant erythrocyte surface antigen-1, alpha subunit [Babesia bovis T2Bo]